MQLFSNTPVMLIEAAVAVVAFGCARWGRVADGGGERHLDPRSPRPRVVVLVASYSYFPFADPDRVRDLYDLALEVGGGRVVVVLAAVPLVLLAVPWLGGLALRFGARARDLAGLAGRRRGGDRAARCARPSRPARSPGCATTRPGSPATSTTSSATPSP